MRRRNDTGSAALELALLTPVLLVVLLFVVALGRIASARETLDGAVGAAARVATLASSPRAAVSAARAQAASSLASGGVSCAASKVTVDVADFTPGGVVSVRVSCRVTLSSAVPGLPGSTTLTATGASVLDRYRSLS
ncbi:MAG: TadE/TadG family type IV pilus assembly protein [Acidimicrobiales bacterium]